MALDPTINDANPLDPGMLTFKHPRARMRNARGEYQSIDVADGGSITGDMTARTGSLTAQGTQRGHGGNSTFSTTQRHNDINKAETRLRTIEQISRYREDKIKREFLKLEEELHLEEAKQRREHERDKRVHEYFLDQK